MDLVVAAGPGVARGLVVPGALLVERFSRSSGPGGQGVNTTDSRVELELRLADLEPLLSPVQFRRLAERLGGEDPSTATLTVAASEHRAQRRNRAAARERLAATIRQALAPPPPRRRPTSPTRGSQERRLAGKRRRAETKAGRGRPLAD